MLVLTRQAGESILIGDDITITIVDNRAGGVRIGINAPADVRITRPEIIEQVEAENRAAITTDVMKQTALIAALAKKPRQEAR